MQALGGDGGGRRMKRVAMLAPMTHELEPLVRLIGLEPDDHDDGLHRGTTGDVEVVSFVTTMGMAAGAAAAERALTLDVDHVMVVGIAGGVDHSLKVGALVVPEIVLDRAKGTSFLPTGAGDVTPRGIVSTGDELITDPATIAAMEAEGVVAVEMESGAVAAVCERAGMPWSVFRGISDFADEGFVTDELFAMTTPDGGSDPDQMRRYFQEHPEQVEVLQRLAQDMHVATEVAANAAIAACTTL
jgi:adenosylhomocysteine nucleosidase